MSLDDLTTDILNGKYDENLDRIIEVTRGRKDFLNRRMFFTLKPGDKVKFNRNTKPKYLQGKTATVVELNNDKVVVDLDYPVGKFNKKVNAPAGLIERV